MPLDLPFTPDLPTYAARTLPPDWVATLHHEGWFKLFLPPAYGGLALSLPAGLEALFRAASCQGSLGWVVNLGSGAGYFWPFMPPETAAAVYGPATAVVAGSGLVGGTATPSPRGYRLDGCWPSCSGAAHATHFTLNARLPRGQVRTFLLARDQVSLQDDWAAFGLRATSSWTLRAEAAAAGPDYVFDIGQVLHPPAGYALPQIAFYPFARYCLLATVLGLGASFCRHLGDTPATRTCEAWIDETLACCYEQAQRSWRSPGYVPEAAFFAQLNQTLFQHATACYFQAGLRITHTNTLAHQAWRDLMVASQHGLLK